MGGLKHSLVAVDVHIGDLAGSNQKRVKAEAIHGAEYGSIVADVIQHEVPGLREDW